MKNDMKTRLTSILIVTAIIGFVVWKLIENRQTLGRNVELSSVVNTVIPVTVEKARYASIERHFSVNGRIIPDNEVTVLSKAVATVLKKHKKAGDAVGRGTVLAQLENGVIRENLRIAETDFAKAQKDVERFQKLASAGAVTVRELEETQITLRSVESRIAELNEQLANTTIVSPAAGIIDRDFFEEGTLLTVGSPVAAIVDGRSLKMELNVTEKEMLKLKTGDKATVTTDIYPGKTFAGTVSVIAPKGNDLYAYAVELALENNSDLKPGMYATAVFGADKNGTQSVVISRKALVGGMKDPHVFVVRDSKAYKVPVQIGQVDADYAEIIEGVSIDDSVVITGQINLKDGSEISILKSL